MYIFVRATIQDLNLNDGFSYEAETQITTT